MAITNLVSKALKETNDPNCAMVMNYAKNFGIAAGAVLCLGIGSFKNLVR